jgi:hypothetical protein
LPGERAFSEKSGSAFDCYEVDHLSESSLIRRGFALLI